MNREKLVWAIELGQRYAMEARFSTSIAARLSKTTTRADHLPSFPLSQNTTLGIPAIFQTEGLHGFIDNGTTFPSPIAMGCSWNPKLMEQSAARFSYEAGALGVSPRGSRFLSRVTSEADSQLSFFFRLLTSSHLCELQGTV